MYLDRGMVCKRGRELERDRERKESGDIKEQRHDGAVLPGSKMILHHVTKVTWQWA